MIHWKLSPAFDYGAQTWSQHCSITVSEMDQNRFFLEVLGTHPGFMHAHLVETCVGCFQSKGISY